MDWHKRFLTIANELKNGSKCAKLQVGCIITKNDRIISSGVNGTPPGFQNCCDKFPNGVKTQAQIYEHHHWSKLHETHAEMNAILAAAKEGIRLENSVLYCTTFPCSECLKNIIQLGFKELYFIEFYSFADLEWSLNHAKNNNLKIVQLFESKFRILTNNIDEILNIIKK